MRRLAVGDGELAEGGSWWRERMRPGGGLVLGKNLELIAGLLGRQGAEGVEAEVDELGDVALGELLVLEGEDAEVVSRWRSRRGSEDLLTEETTDDQDRWGDDLVEVVGASGSAGPNAGQDDHVPDCESQGSFLTSICEMCVAVVLWPLR